MKKKALFFAIAIAVTGVSALAGADNANAASVYDNALQIHPANQLKVESSSTIFSTFDIGTWLAGTNYGSCSETQFNAIKNALLNNYAYSISQAFYNGNRVVVTIGVDTDNSGINSVYWTSTSVIAGEFDMTATISRTGTGNWIQCNGPETTYISGVSTPYTYKLVEYRGFSLNYPADYEGNILDPLLPPLEQSDYTPDFYVSVATDWKATIHDQNFNTFDEVPFLCSDDLAPVLHYEIWDRTADPEQLLTTGTQSATAQIVYQFEKKNTNNEYRVVGWYECGDEPIFTDSSFFDFTITSTGMLYNQGLETCIQESFPFFDMESCIGGLNSTLALLSFNLVNPSNDSLVTVANNNPNNCHTLGTLDDWLNRPDQQVCPAFSSEVRNTITPFVTFILGATVLYYISRGKGQVID